MKAERNEADSKHGALRARVVEEERRADEAFKQIGALELQLSKAEAEKRDLRGVLDRVEQRLADTSKQLEERDLMLAKKEGLVSRNRKLENDLKEFQEREVLRLIGEVS